LLLWKGIGSWGAEVSQVRLDEDRLSATGTQMGVEPLPYRVDYELTTGPSWATQHLGVVAVGGGWRRQLDLRHNGEGRWTCTTDEEGDVNLPSPGGDMTAVAGALEGLLRLDDEGFVLSYPDLAERVLPATGDTAAAITSVPLS